MTEIYFPRLKSPDAPLACMLEVAGFILNLSSPSVPSVDGVSKNICVGVFFCFEWILENVFLLFKCKM